MLRLNYQLENMTCPVFHKTDMTCPIYCKDCQLLNQLIEAENQKYQEEIINNK